MKSLYLRNLLALGTVMMLTASCTAPAGRLQITAMRHESLQSHPEAYKRLAIVPIWFTTSAYRYSGLTGSELQQIARAASRNTASILAATITNRGYQVVGEQGVLGSEDDLAGFDAETCQLLDDVRVEFRWLTQSVQTEAGVRTSGLPFRYKLKAPLLQLQRKLGAPPADALVLVDSTVFVETSAGRGKRLLWNWTGAPLVTTAVHSAAFVRGLADTNAPDGPVAVSCPATIEHTMAIVDPRTQDVLLWTSVLTPGANVREAVDLRVTIFDLLSALPLIEPPPRQP